MKKRPLEVSLQNGEYVKHVDFSYPDVIGIGLSALDPEYKITYLSSENEKYVYQAINHKTEVVKNVRLANEEDLCALPDFTLVFVAESENIPVEYYGYFEDNKKLYEIFPNLISKEQKEFFESHTFTASPTWLNGHQCIGLSYKYNENGEVFDETAFMKMTVKDILKYCNIPENAGIVHSCHLK